MYDVVIIDDEVLARDHLLNMLRWEDHGYHIKAVYNNGSSAAEELSFLQPDIIISDVYMPGMSGIELSRHVAQHYPAIKMIMLSGYDSYDYIRETFYNGAVDYLLKDRLNEQMLISALDKAKQGLAGRAGVPETFERGGSGAADAERLRDWFAADAGEAAPHDLHAMLELGGIHPGQRTAVVAAIRIENYAQHASRLSEEGRSSWVQSILTLSSQHFPGLPLHMGQELFAFIMEPAESRSELLMTQEIEQQMKRLQNVLGKFMNIQLACAISCPCQQPDKLARCYQAAERKLMPERHAQPAGAAHTGAVAVAAVQAPALAAADVSGEIIVANAQQGAGAKLSHYMRKALQYIDEHYHEPLSLVDTAAHVGLAPAYLSRLFRKETGMAFVEVLNKVRIEAVKKRIVEGGRIKDIAEQTGFNNYNYLFRVFKSIEGMTPAEYERNQR